MYRTMRKGTLLPFCPRVKGSSYDKSSLGPADWVGQDRAVVAAEEHYTN